MFYYCVDIIIIIIILLVQNLFPKGSAKAVVWFGGLGSRVWGMVEVRVKVSMLFVVRMKFDQGNG